jgi:hypothetical protein
MGASKNSNFFVTFFCSAPTVGARGENSIHAVLAISVTVRRPGGPACRRFGDPKHRTDDCMDVEAGVPAVRRSEGRAMPAVRRFGDSAIQAIAENRSVHRVHEDRWGGLPSDWRASKELPKVGAMRRRHKSWPQWLAPQRSCFGSHEKSAFLEVP